PQPEPEPARDSGIPTPAARPASPEWREGQAAAGARARRRLKGPPGSPMMPLT
ncbi:hypothetical protein RJZ56_008190, partial [Blastomyces dermatitidis]